MSVNTPCCSLGNRNRGASDESQEKHSPDPGQFLRFISALSCLLKGGGNTSFDCVLYDSQCLIIWRKLAKTSMTRFSIDSSFILGMKMKSVVDKKLSITLMHLCISFIPVRRQVD